tara:strand:+ start:29320 stop:30606 length:1287 start_codon:yes stop_codon:yes gene_type:complete
MLEWVMGRRTSAKKPLKAGQKKKPSYEESKKIAAKGDSKARAALAAHEDLEPEFLYLFASDKDATVRRAVAENEGSPLQADLLLARDVDQGVREELAYKIGRLVPTLTDDESESLAEMAFAVLEILATDQAPQIRTIIADEIKHLSNVPKKIILRLAKDAAATVAGPILEYSPLLNDDQLLQIIASGLRGGALEALARRKGLSAALSKAVVAAEEDPAIAELLRNRTAKISDKLMNEIAIRAEQTPDLHLPLVDRGSLSQSTLRRIAMFVSANLIDRLISANCLDDSLAHDIRMAVRERIEEGDATTADDDDKEDNGAERADQLHKAGKLDEYAILDGIDEKNIAFLTRGFTLLSKLPEAHVTRMLESESAKGLCALTWKAGFGADIAVSLQRRIGNIPSKSMIHEAEGGGYKLAEEELKWYVDYFDT